MIGGPSVTVKLSPTHEERNHVSEPGSTADPVDDVEVVYDLSTWSEAHIGELLARLRRDGVTFTVAGDELSVDKRFEAAADRAVTSIDGAPPTWPPPGA
jgi:hypothetical protein